MTRARYVILLLAACGGGSPATRRAEPGPGTPFEEDLALLRRFADRACGCRDATCAKNVDADFEKLLRDEMPTGDSDEAAQDEAEKQRFGDEMVRMYRCISATGVPGNSLGVVALWRFTLVKDRACACTDSTCVRRAIAEWDGTLEEAGKFPGSPRTIDEITEINRVAQECFATGMKLVVEDALIELKALRKRACECGDAECTASVRTDFDAWVDANRQTNADETTMEHFREVAVELGGCLAPPPAE